MITITKAGESPASAQLLTASAVAFLEALHRKFEGRRRQMLQMRRSHQSYFDSGRLPRLRPDTAHIRRGDWTVKRPALSLKTRLAEITAPAEPKLIINALNSGADVFMADFEDAFSPVWNKVLTGHLSLKQAVDGTLTYSPAEGKRYALSGTPATLVVRPRALHQTEEHFLVDGESMSAALFDIGLYFHNCAATLVSRCSAPHYYLAKLESYLEAELFADVFAFAERWSSLPQGSTSCTVLIETLPAAFQMDEILYALKDFAPSLNAGKFDYLFSIVSKLRAREDLVMPERRFLLAGSTAMDSYMRLLVDTCKRRDAQAIGGMSASLPHGSDSKALAAAIESVKAEKKRELEMGFDGTWVAHPALVQPVRALFGAGKTASDRKSYQQLAKTAESLTSRFVGDVSEAGVRTCIKAAISFFGHWLNGKGAVAVDGSMEDAATAELSRSLLWQWVQHRARLKDGRRLTAKLYEQLKRSEIAKLKGVPHLHEAQQLLDQLVLTVQFTDHFEEPAYRLLHQKHDAAAK